MLGLDENGELAYYYKNEEEVYIPLLENLVNLLQKKDKKIERLKNINEKHRILNGKLREENKRLNNIINDLLKRQNEALNYISNFLSMDNRYKHGNGNDELELVRRILNKHNQELKGNDKE